MRSVIEKRSTKWLSTFATFLQKIGFSGSKCEVHILYYSPPRYKRL